MTQKGWDAETRQPPTTLEAMRKDGYTVAGFYLGGPRASTTHLGHGYATLLHLHGFVMVPVYVGYQKADLDGKSPQRIAAMVAATVKDAEALLAKLVKESPRALYAKMALDWEGPLTQEGAAYCRGVLDAIPRAQYLYRTDAGTLTPARQTWLAKPGTSEADAIALLGAQPYGDVDGVQHTWNPGMDLSVWADSVIPAAPPVKPKPKSLAWYFSQALKLWRAGKHEHKG